MRILILSNIEDPHSYAVVECLKKRDDVSVDLLRFENLDFSRISATALLSNSAVTARISRERDELNLMTYDAIWHRRPGMFPHPRFAEPWIGQMVEQEVKSSVLGTLYGLDCLWVNFPPNDNVCSQKLLQLKLAKASGLCIPDTLITSEPARATEFYESCGGQVIYKMVSELSNFYVPQRERPAGIGTQLLRKVDLDFIQQVTHSPHLFQKCISKDADIRVTLIGEEIFAIRINSQQGKGKLDWRQDYSVSMEPHELPKNISDACRTLAKKLRLNYGAIDLILDKEGQYHFLEINCAGQYLWIEEKTGIKLSQAIADLLAGDIQPLTPKGCH